MFSSNPSQGTPKPSKPSTSRAGYEQHREKMREKSAEQSKQGRDLGPIPPVKNQERRDSCEHNFRLFCETYLGPAFKLGWSRDHLKVIKRIEDAVLRGSLSAFAMPRGSGKTTLCRIAVIWALLYGHRKWGCLIGATDKAARSLLRAIKKDLRWNKLLREDFPETCVPFAALEDEPRRCKGQMSEGLHTQTDWTIDRVVFPTVAGSKVSGSVLSVCGLTGNVRGQFENLSDGTVFRPDLVFLDDPQTRESAGSAKQNVDRLELLNGDVLGLAGPDTAIAGLMACTVIRQGDMADTILDSKKSPEWQSERTRLVDAFPTNTDMWDNYFRIREEDLATGGDGKKASDYYLANLEAMNAGADVPWAARFPKKFHSAIESAMVLQYREPSVFASEYQNAPIDATTADSTIRTANEIASHINGFKKGVVPSNATYLTAYIDISQTVLWWTVAAWKQDFTGYVVDYGAYPEQGRFYYSLRDLSKPIAKVHKGGLEAQITASLGKLTEKLLGNEWSQDGNQKIRISRCLIDANWGKMTSPVYQFCRQSPHAAVLMPSHGHGVKADAAPMMHWAKKEGEELGHNWRIRRTTTTQAPIRHIVYDTNYWKTFLHARLSQEIGDRGCVSLFNAEQYKHQMFADQLSAEQHTLKPGRNREVDEWKNPPGADNHFFDCLVGCAVVASTLGASLAENEQVEVKQKRKLVIDFD